MAERIPLRIDHRRYTDKGVILDGLMSREESAKELLRFHEAILASSAEISYHLEFNIDFLGNRYVKGKVSTQVILQCQRCMGNMELGLSCDIATAFVSDENEQKLADESSYEVFWLSKKEYLDPRVLIEDELLLALPQIAMHPLSEIGKSCNAEVVFLDEHSEQDDYLDKDGKHSDQMDNNPFAILKQLKK